MDIKMLVSFIKAGYKASEIKEIPADSRQQYIDLLESGISKDDISTYIDLLQAQDNNPEGGKDQDPPGSDPEDDVKDYKQMYEELLKRSQQLEINHDNSDDFKVETAVDILNEFLGG